MNGEVYDSICALADEEPFLPKLAAGRKYSDYTLDDLEWKFLKLAAQVLEESASTAQIFSQSGGMLLYRVVPAMETIRDLWEAHIDDTEYTEIKGAIETGLRGLWNEHPKNAETDVYAETGGYVLSMRRPSLAVAGHEKTLIKFTSTSS